MILIHEFTDLELHQRRCDRMSSLWMPSGKLGSICISHFSKLLHRTFNRGNALTIIWMETFDSKNNHFDPFWYVAWIMQHDPRLKVFEILSQKWIKSTIYTKVDQNGLSYDLLPQNTKVDKIVDRFKTELQITFLTRPQQHMTNSMLSCNS